MQNLLHDNLDKYEIWKSTSTISCPATRQSLGKSSTTKVPSSPPCPSSCHLCIHFCNLFFILFPLFLHVHIKLPADWWNINNSSKTWEERKIWCPNLWRGSSGSQGGQSIAEPGSIFLTSKQFMQNLVIFNNIMSNPRREINCRTRLDNLFVKTNHVLWDLLPPKSYNLCTLMVPNKVRDFPLDFLTPTATQRPRASPNPRMRPSYEWGHMLYTLGRKYNILWNFLKKRNVKSHFSIFDELLPDTEIAYQFLLMASGNEPVGIMLEYFRTENKKTPTCMSVNCTVVWNPLRSRPNPSSCGSPRLSRSLWISKKWKWQKITQYIA